VGPCPEFSEYVDRKSFHGARASLTKTMRSLLSPVNCVSVRTIESFDSSLPDSYAAGWVAVVAFPISPLVPSGAGDGWGFIKLQSCAIAQGFALVSALGSVLGLGESHRSKVRRQDEP
jgi:hypothetical protein